MPSSRQFSTTNTTTNTTTTSPAPPPTTPSTLAETPSKPFRLLNLPFELVSQILEHSIEGVSSETEPIEIAFSSSSCVTTTTTPIIEEIEEDGEEEEKTTREEGEKTTTTREEDVDIIEMKYPHHNNQEEAPHPGIFQTCQLLRSEGPSPFPPPPKPPAKKPPKINLFPFFLFFYLALHIHLSKSFFTFPCAGPGIRGIRLDDAAAAEKKNLVDEVYLKMREELLAGRNGMLRGRRGEEEEVGLGADADLKKDVVW